jgi:DNA-binding PucR family transcriptional regulator
VAWLDTELAEELLGHYAGRVAVAAAGDETFAVVPAGEAPDGGALAAWLREAAPVLRAAGIRLTVGMSALVLDTTGLTAALSEASAARRAVSARPARPEGTPAGREAVVIAISAEVDSHELLLASVPAPVLRSFRDRLLGPLLDYDRRHNAELLPTLKSFLASDGSWSACASRMYVHVNTVRYRVGRIESLTGRDLSALSDRVDFFLALRVT